MQTVLEQGSIEKNLTFGIWDAGQSLGSKDLVALEHNSYSVVFRALRTCTVMGGCALVLVDWVCLIGCLVSCLGACVLCDGILLCQDIA